MRSSKVRINKGALTTPGHVSGVVLAWHPGLVDAPLYELLDRDNYIKNTREK